MKIQTLFLKSALIGIGVVVLLFCIFAFPRIPGALIREYPHIGLERPLFMVGLYGSALFFYVAEFHAYHILQLVDHNDVFSGQALKSIATIKHVIFAMGICYLAFLPLIYRVADYEDAPGLILIGGAVVLVPFTISVFAAILEKLLKKATAINLENQYTV
ncbi:MAG: DUF2975 domain-containing protein [Lactobacillus sp.]|jgi:hypothetical protein|nr:DUF2975 domain-containing protein [Lactobacillus sp.]